MTKHLSRMTAPFAAAVVCSLLLLATAQPASAATQHTVLKRAVKSYSDKFLGGRGAAYKMLTGRCQDKFNRHKFIAESDLAKEIYGGPIPFTSFHATINGRQARATYTYAASAINQTREPWLKVSGHWRYNQC